MSTQAAANSAAALPESMQVLMIGLQSELFAVDVGLVREILDPVPVTEVPGERGFLSGIINVRGKVVPVADLPAYDVPEAALEVVREGLRRCGIVARISSNTSHSEG